MHRLLAPIFALCLTIPLTAASLRWEGDPIEPLHAPFAMPALQRPTLPDRMVSIRDFGAIPGGKVKNTEAFSRAIAACAKAGGGRVLVPDGQWLTGPIHLQSNIDLHLSAGAEVIFSDQPEDYLPVVLVRVGGIELYNYSPLIYARDCENVAVTGTGKLNGNAATWWKWQSRENREFFDMGARGVPVEKRIFGTPEAAIRPSFLCLVNCRNILLEGFTIGSGPNWTIHPVYCENMIIRRVNVDTHGPNNDGIDPDSCKNLLIEHCRFRTGDDCVVLKSGYNEDGWRVGKPTENVIMRHCYSNEGHGGLVIGSEMSGDVRNVYLHDCEFDGTDRAIRIKSRRGRGGVVENILAENIAVKNMQREVVILNMDYGSDTKALTNLKPPLFRNITVRHVTADGSPVAVKIAGLEDSPIQNIRFENMEIHSKEGIVASHVKDLHFDQVKLDVTQGPAFDLSHAQDILITHATLHNDGTPLLQVGGKDSAAIRVTHQEQAITENEIKLTDGAPTGSVLIR